MTGKRNPRDILLVVIFVLFISFLLSSKAYCKKTHEKYALLIGIGDYHLSHLPSLQGAVNDIQLIEKVLAGKFFLKKDNIRILMNAAATHENIRKSFVELVNKIHHGDTVYIHYSGHGSQTCDINGDELEETTNMDSTWVPYGARQRLLTDKNTIQSDCKFFSPAGLFEASRQAAEQGVDINDYDILDDEIFNWLHMLSEKTPHVIFVSDSCHSGTVTRGEKTRTSTRSVQGDLRPHPLGTMKKIADNEPWMRISASRDNEQAHEFRSNNKVYGLLTWCWARALEQAAPGATWRDMFNETKALVESKNSIQHPVFTVSNDNTLLFQGVPAATSKRYTVTAVLGDEVIIDSGSLLGMTPGAVLRKYGSNKNNSDMQSLTIVTVKPLRSIGKSSGIFHVGDRLELVRRTSGNSGIKIAVQTDLPEDSGFKEKLEEIVRQVFPDMPLTQDATENDLVLRILHPGKATGKNSLHQTSASGAVPEVWLFDPAGTLCAGKHCLIARLNNQGLKRVKQSLLRLGQLKHIESLTASDRSIPVAISARVFRKLPDQTCSERSEKRIPCFKRTCGDLIGTYSDEELSHVDVRKKDYIQFVVANKSKDDLYVYVINYTPSGSIAVGIPSQKRGESFEDCLVKSGKRRSFYKTCFMVTNDNEYFCFLYSKKAVANIWSLEQPGLYESTRSGKIKKKSLLNQILSNILQSDARDANTATIRADTAWGMKRARFLCSGN